jgi:serine/threonine protein kinase
MDAKWEQMKELFQSALSRAPDERAAFLRDACGSDDSLRSELQSLLASYESEKSSEVKVEDVPSPEDIPEGRIGAYQVIRGIGSGGMGAVYLAVRADDAYKKRVAIKVVQTGVDTREVSRRFQRERQILAALDHPNIARLVDGGTTQQGLSYFVMDYIEGTRIDQYCDRHKLGTAERIGLFRQICSAVQYVHQNLIVHRDLKPGNILVTPEGIPKLLDFGIAKLLKPELFASPIDATRVEFQLMTPRYASPEQIRGEAITVASDVYSLGVILYELLTSCRPYRLTGTSQHEILNAVCDQEPEKPSAAITTVEAEPIDGEQPRSPELLARLHGTVPKKLRSQLRGELDNIVLKALRKEPQLRYSSGEQLSEDLRRYLQGLPVTAHQDTWTYRCSKFVGRHKAGVAAAALIFISLVGGILGIAWQARIARRERAEARRQFNNVRRLATSFLFEFHSAIQDLPGSTPARQLMVQRALDYLGKLAEESNGDRSLQLDLAEAYLKVGDVQGNPYLPNVGDPEGAAESYTKALQISLALVQGDGQDHAARRCLARSNKLLGQVLAILGKPSAAAADLRSATEILQSLVAADPHNEELRTDLAQSYQVLGDVLGHGGLPNLGDPVGALDSYRKALALEESVLSADPNNKTARNAVALLQIRIGQLRSDQDDLQDALKYYRNSLDIFEELSAADPNNAQNRRMLSIAYRKVGDVQYYLGQNKLALKNYLKATSIDESLVAADPANFQASMSLAISLRECGDLMVKSHNPSGALAYYRRVLQIFERLSAQNSKDQVLRSRYSEMLVYTGQLLAKMNQLDEARSMTGQGLALARNLASGADVTSDDLSQYALDFLTCEPASLRDSGVALRYAEQSVAKAENSYSLDVLAQAYFQTGQTTRAIATEEKALSLIPTSAAPSGASTERKQIESHLSTFRAAQKRSTKK